MNEPRHLIESGSDALGLVVVCAVALVAAAGFVAALRMFLRETDQ